MSTPQDSFAEEESEHNNSLVKEPTALTGEQANKPMSKKQQPGVPAAPGPTGSTLPPEAEGEANGGPLGCCLGVTVGLLLSLSIAVFSRFYADTLSQIFGSSLSLIVRVVMVLIAVIAVIVCGYFGWKIGKNAYREYEPPVVKDRRKKKTRSAVRSKRPS